MSSALFAAIGRPASVAEQLTDTITAEPLYPNACSTEDCTELASVQLGAFQFCPGCRADLVLPACEPYRAGENVVEHGARVLTFILQTSCTATLSDTELERAEIAAKYAIVARGILPAAATRISDCRHVIAGTLRARAADKAEQLRTLQDGRGQPASPKGSDREPLQPGPKTQPPAGDAIDLGAELEVRQLEQANAAGRPWQGGDRIRF